MNKLELKNFKKINLLTKKALFTNLFYNDLIIITSSNNLKILEQLKSKSIKFNTSSLKNSFVKKILQKKKINIDQFIGNIVYISIKKDFSNTNTLKEFLSNTNIDYSLVLGIIWKHKIFPINRVRQLLNMKNTEYKILTIIHNQKNTFINTLYTLKKNL